jgi:glycosyltransferase involved in cell wall biosynthesis
MKNVILRGPFLTLSGYGVHSRQIARWALSHKEWNVKIHATPWGITPWYLDSQGEGGLIGKIMERTVDLRQQTSKADMSVQVQLPNEWDPSIAKINIGVSACVETDRCNPQWVDACNRMSAIVVPTTFTKKTLENTGNVKVPIIVIPESFYDEILDEEIQPLDYNFSTKFNFLVFGQLTGNNPENDRKNLFYTVKWLCEEFKDNPDVGIILKTNSGKATKIDRMVTQKFLNDLLKTVRPGKFPKVHLLHGKMTNEDMVSLYRHESVNALVTLTRGEGFGLPILEAAAAGVPVIATGWSGHKDFMGKGRYIIVDYDLEEIHPSRVDGSVFIKGSRWANVKEGDAKKKIRKFYEKPDIPKRWSKELSLILKNEYSWEAIKELYDLHLGKLL